MSELRRILIDKHRLESNLLNDSKIKLFENESHYLRNVLRYKSGQLINIIDGNGHMWDAKIASKSELILLTDFMNPLVYISPPKVTLGIAFVAPKNGTKDILRMCTEIGIDSIQPLSSSFGNKKVCLKNNLSRNIAIIKEAVEQSERLWMPKLSNTITFEEFIIKNNKNSSLLIGTTRDSSSQNLHISLKDSHLSNIFIIIGPEGGWSDDELNLAKKNNCKFISFSNNILRTSTAAVAASQLLISWRNLNYLKI